MQIYAHRGNSSQAPENTLAAFRAAQQAGAFGLEFDVQLTRDGVAVVFHDERLERTSSGTGWVGEHTAAELRALDAGRWYGATFQGERIPSFAELLDAFAEGPLVLNVELKTNRVPYPGLVAEVAGQIRRRGLAKRAIVSSFNHHSLREMQAVAPEIACAPILYDRLLEPWDYAKRNGFTAIHVHFSQVDEALMAGCRKAGLAVRAWTVDDVPAARHLKELGVDAVISNRPAELLAGLK